MSDYYFKEEHNIFREGLRQFLDKEVKPNIDEWEKNQQIPKSIWKKFGDMGYLGLNYPEEYGGIDGDFWYSVVFLEEISKVFSGGFTITPTVIQYMSSPYIFHHGSERLKNKYLKGIISGEVVSCIGITEPGAGSDAANIQTKAIRKGDHYVLNGSKTFITNGYYGDIVIGVVKTDPSAGTGGVSLLVIDLDAEGVSKRKLDKLGWHASDTAELHFDDVKVPLENLIGEEGRGFYYLMGGLQLERLAGAIMGYASCEDVIQYSLQYMSEREAFGRPINKFQVLRHRIAQLTTEIESAKYFVYHIARMHNDGKFAVKEVSMAKLLCSELADKCMYQCLQFFGGNGFMEDFKMARAFRDSRVGTIGGGSSEIMREIIAKMVIDDVAYKSVFKKEDIANGTSQSTKPATAKEILLGLPERLKSEKAFNIDTVFHFDIAGENGGIFTVKIQNGICEVVEGQNGDAKCLVETEASVYEDVELGKVNAQEAFMTGKIKVSDIGEMMKFGGLFKRIK